MTQDIEANKASVDMSDSNVGEGLSRRGHFAFNWSDIEEITLPNGDEQRFIAPVPQSFEEAAERIAEE